MCVDNIFWIPDSAEFSKIRKGFKVFTFFGREYAWPYSDDAWSYVWKNRVLEVLKHPRDIFPALLTSSILAFLTGGK